MVLVVRNQCIQTIYQFFTILTSKMMMKKILPIFTLMICGSNATKDLYAIRPVGMLCQVLDPTIVAKLTCRSKNFNRTVNLGFKEIIYQPSVSLTDVHVKVQAYRKFATIYRPFLVTLDLDWCSMLTDETSVIHKLLNVADRRKYGNLYDPCPMTGRRYERRQAEYDKYPDLLPDGEYRLELIYYTHVKGNRTNYLRMVAMGVIRPKKAEQWRRR